MSTSTYIFYAALMKNIPDTTKNATQKSHNTRLGHYLQAVKEDIPKQ